MRQSLQFANKDTIFPVSLRLGNRDSMEPRPLEAGRRCAPASGFRGGGGCKRSAGNLWNCPRRGCGCPRSEPPFRRRWLFRPSRADLSVRGRALWNGRPLPESGIHQTIFPVSLRLGNSVSWRHWNQKRPASGFRGGGGCKRSRPRCQGRVLVYCALPAPVGRRLSDGQHTAFAGSLLPLVGGGAFPPGRYRRPACLGRGNRMADNLSSLPWFRVLRLFDVLRLRLFLGSVE